MTAQELISGLSQAIYLVLLAVATIRLIRRPAWATFDTFLFFAIAAAILLVVDAARLVGLTGEPAVNVFIWVAVSALPYVLLRLADDFRPQPVPIMVAASLAFGIVAVIGVLAPQPWSSPVRLVPVAFVVPLGTYASWAFLRESRTSIGVTRRRMQAVALGSSLLVVGLLLAGVALVLPSGREILLVASQVVGLGMVLSYFTGFAPPPILRRAWQEPALRALLAEAADLTRLRDVHAITDRIQRRVTAITGADGTTIGLWDEPSGQLAFWLPDGEVRTQAPGEWIGGRAFERQEVVFSDDPEHDAPEHAADYRASGVRAIVAAPITAEDERIGILIVYAARPPLFTDDVLALVELMAEQAALVLRGNQLLRESAEVRALAEVTRLKDDFLSVVAHDVRTPLTTILLNAELLERDVASDGPSARRVASLRSEAIRLKQLVEDYLDVVRAEHERSLRPEAHDLVALVRDSLVGMGEPADRVTLTGEQSIPGVFDGRRIGQLVQNLVANALKYSQDDQPVEVRVIADGEAALISVTDHGIGIPDTDLPLLFERFHRGTNADDRRYGGLGLGLFICRQIAEEHGGSIGVTSSPGAGSTFTVRLPRSVAREAAVATP